MSLVFRLGATSARVLPCCAALALGLTLALSLTLAGASATAADAAPARAGSWLWPLPMPDRVVASFVAPASPYAAGHRGIDLAADAGDPVIAPAAGTVLFAGVVVDRPLVTLQLDDGTLLSMEPLRATPAVGDHLAAGVALGTVAHGGHCDGRCLHVGVRVDGAYVSPLLFFADVPAAVLLPLR